MSNPTEDVTPDTITTAHTDIGAAVAAAMEAHEPRNLLIERGDTEHASVLVVPNGMKVFDPLAWLDARRPVPVRAKGTSAHTTLESLVAHVARNKRAHTTVAWLAQTGASAELSVVYNYNDPLTDNAPGLPEKRDAGWCDHRAVYAFPLSEPWAAWRAVDGKPMTQADFAAFLEARAAELAGVDTAGPLAMEVARALFDADAEDDAVTNDQAASVIASPKRMLKMGRRMSLCVEERAKEERDRHGNVSIVYVKNVTEENPDGSKVDEFKRPSMFLIRVPVYHGGTEYVLPVRLETKVAGGRAQWTVRLHRPDLALTRAQDDIAASFAANTGLQVFRGTMEVLKG